MGRQLSRGVAWVATTCVAYSLTLANVPAASALEYEEVPVKVEPVPIVAGGLIGGDSPMATPDRRTFTFSVSSGFCVGNPKPRIDRVRVVERPKTADRPFKSSVITAFLLYPAYLRAIPPSPPPSNVVYNACAGVGLPLTKRIKLKRPAADLFFFDGSYPRPHRVWLRSAGAPQGGHSPHFNAYGQARFARLPPSHLCPFEVSVVLATHAYLGQDRANGFALANNGKRLSCALDQPPSPP